MRPPRKIRFRAWHEKTKKFIFCSLDDGVILMEDPDMILVNSPSELSPWQQVSNVPNSDRGDIYEGDIVSAIINGVQIYGVMTYDHSDNRFGVDSDVSVESRIEMGAFDDTYEVKVRGANGLPTVIGNNRANPELLDGVRVIVNKIKKE